MCFTGTWLTTRESNPRPKDSESFALPTELVVVEMLKGIEPSTFWLAPGALPLSYNISPFKRGTHHPQCGARQPGLREPGHMAFKREVGCYIETLAKKRKRQRSVDPSSHKDRRITASCRPPTTNRFSNGDITHLCSRTIPERTAHRDFYPARCRKLSRRVRTPRKRRGCQ